MHRLSSSCSKSVGQMLSLSNLLFHSLLYFSVALTDLEMSTGFLHSLLSLSWNCNLVFFFFKVGGFDSSGSSWEKHLSFHGLC